MWQCERRPERQGAWRRTWARTLVRDVLEYMDKYAMTNVVMNAMVYVEEDKSVSASEDMEEGAPYNPVLTAE